MDNPLGMTTSRQLQKGQGETKHEPCTFSQPLTHACLLTNLFQY